ncbi:MAG: flavoprotein [Promethearchaeota archaeon]
MPAKFAWAITGAGDYLKESVEAIREVLQSTDYKVMIFMSKAGEKVVNWYKLMEDIKALTSKVKVEIDANTPFILGALQRCVYDFLVVMPATANTVAKIVHGIADTLVTNSVAQAQKTDVPWP